jgi:hypothetical protein
MADWLTVREQQASKILALSDRSEKDVTRIRMSSLKQQGGH